MFTSIPPRPSQWDWKDRVLDAFGRVYRLHGLMVVDASIMPFVPWPTNLTTIMIAEHVARHCLVLGSAKATPQKWRIER
jgi:choline dehydrogenase-like flavoprotein